MATKTAAAPAAKTITIKPPNFGRMVFDIESDGPPLVLHRFSAKTKLEMLAKSEAGKTPTTKVRVARDADADYNNARYTNSAGWDGFQASAVRKAMISACRLVNFKMTLAKMSIFVIADGYDEKEPQIPLVRIYGSPVRQDDMARVETGQPYICIRPAYHDWKAKVQIKWDLDQFSETDITNLLMRVGEQVGIGEGRADSKNSAGMGWGSFRVTGAHAAKNGKVK